MLRRIGFASVLVCLLAFVFGMQFAYAQTQSSLTRHTRDVVQNGQARPVGRLSPTEILRIVIVLPLRNQAALETFLKELYDPASPSYRQ